MASLGEPGGAVLHLAIRIMGDISLTFVSCLCSVSGAEILSPEGDTFNSAERTCEGVLSRRRFTEDGSKRRRDLSRRPVRA